MDVRGVSDDVFVVLCGGSIDVALYSDIRVTFMLGKDSHFCKEMLAKVSICRIGAVIDIEKEGIVVVDVHRKGV